MPIGPFGSQVYGARLCREAVGTSSVDAPIVIIVFEYDGITVINTVGPILRGIRTLFTAHVRDGTFYSIDSIANAPGDVTLTFRGSPTAPTIVRAAGVDYAGVAIATSISTNTVDIVWDSSQKAVLAVW
ncbi:MAG TPA: hypothetical protein VK540_15925 [Polyangiaceae bacterium]|nr:hypothetical protein [Polyangiaceae bacterium]